MAVLVFLVGGAAAYPQQLEPIDPDFRISAALNSEPARIAVDKLDRVIAAGDFVVMVNGHAQRGIARFLANGALDSSFDCGSGFDAGITPASLQVASDNKIVVVGNFTSFNGKAATGLIRLTSSGSIDNGFVADVVAPGLTAIDSRDRLYVVDGTILVRLSATGAKDATFQPYAPDGSVLTLAADSEDKPIFVFEKHVSAPLGIKNYVTSSASATIARLSDAGAIEYSKELWSQESMIDFVNLVGQAQIVPADNGSYYLSYFIWHSGLGQQVGDYVPIRRYFRDGSLDSTFVTDLYGRIVRDGTSEKIYVLDAFIVPESTNLPGGYKEPVRLLPDGSEDIRFNSEGTSLAPADYNHPGSIQDAAVTSRGALLITFTGSVPTDGGESRAMLARYRYNDYTPLAPSLGAPLPANAYAVSGEAFSLTASASGTPPLQYEWLRDGAVIATGATFTLASPQSTDGGSYRLRVTSPYGVVTSAPMDLQVQPQTPTVVAEPQPLALTDGEVGTLSALVTGLSPLSFQWFKDGSAIIGATKSTLTLTGTRAVEGDYCLVAGNSKGTATTASVHVSFVTTHLVNISTRSWVGAGESVQIAGFVIQGSAPKTVLIRAAGPALLPLHVTGVLSNPKLELHDAVNGNIVIASNDDWSAQDTIASGVEKTAARVGAFAWERGSKDAAILTMLPPGIYTAVVSGADSGSGVAMIEVYDADEISTGSRLVNISTRARARPGDEATIAGFVIDGTEKRSVLIRGVGPSSFNVGGVLDDPNIELHDARHDNVVIAANDDWGTNATLADQIAAAAEKTGAFKLTPGNKDSALLMALDPGIYTVVLRGKGAASGNALIEIYDVP